jgi:hypothetical protein
MAQADDVPTQLRAQITGAKDNSSTNPIGSISMRLFAWLAECTPPIDARVYDEAFRSDISSIARSAS